MSTHVTDLAVRAEAYDIPGIVVDGQDAEAVCLESKSAIERARQGAGPTLLELKTYRFRGHSRTDPAAYRPAGELEQWLERDPTSLLKGKMIVDRQLDEAEFAGMKQAAEAVARAAIEWAKAEPYPSVEELFQDVYYEA